MGWLWLVPCAVWILTTALTSPHNMGDTADYASSIIARLWDRDYRFWDFGHLYWRPAGWVLTEAALPFAPDVQRRVVAATVLKTLSWLAAPAAALCLLATMRRLRPQATGLAALTATAFLLLHAVLNFGQAGVAYLPGLFFIALALFLVVRSRDGSPGEAVGAGGATAFAAALWFPYVLVSPAVLIASKVLRSRAGWRFPLTVAGAGLAAALILFPGTGLAIGLRTLADFQEWFAHAGHGIDGSGGLPRALLGFGRSVIHIGNDGIVMRRFIEGDVLAPVSFAQVIATRIWLVALVPLLSLAIGFHAVRSRSCWPALATFGAAAIPVFGFGLLWQGGDLSRYFPLLPFLMILIFTVLWSSGRGFRGAMAAALAIVSVSNVAGLSRSAAQHRRDAVNERLASFYAEARMGDHLIVSHMRDDVSWVSSTFPYDSPTGKSRFRVNFLTPTFIPGVRTWREGFVYRVNEAWSRNANVWISTRLLEPRPDPEWLWIEGAEPAIRWREFPAFFTTLDLAGPADGTDTFVLLERTEGNESLLAGLTPPASTAR